MNSKDENNIKHLLDEFEYTKFFDRCYDLLNSYAFVVDENGKVPDFVDEYLKSKFKHYSLIDERLKNAAKIISGKKNKDNFLITIRNSSYQFYFKSINIYNYHFGYFGVIFNKDHKNLKKIDAMYNFFSEIARLKFETMDLIKENVTHYKEMSLLTRVNEGALYASSIAEIYKRTLDIAIGVCGGKNGMVFSLDSNGSILELLNVIPKPSKNNEGFALLMDDNIFSVCLKQFKAVILNNVNNRSNFIHPLPFLKPHQLAFLFLYRNA